MHSSSYIDINDSRYDEYFENNRDSSAAFGVGMGLLGEVSDEDEDEDDCVSPAHPSSGAPKSKNQALLEAVSRSSPAATTNGPPVSSPSSGIPQSKTPHPPPQTPQSTKGFPIAREQNSDHIHGRQLQTQSQPRAQPKSSAKETHGREDARRPPGITIPPAAATTAQLATSPQFSSSPQQIHQHAPPPIDQAPSPATPPRDVPTRVATGSPMPAPRPQRPAPAFMIVPGSPAPSSPAPSYRHTPPTAHSPMMPTTPLQLPSSTPITPLFAAPPPSVLEQEEKKVSFGVMRGENEDVLLERTREKRKGSDDSYGSIDSRTGLRNKARNDGDDFWRRFSMVAHQAESDARNPRKQSSWLAKTERNARAHSRWVAISGVLLLCLIGAGIAAGVFLSKGKGNGHAAPLAIGGKANESNITTPTSTSTAHSTKRTGYLHQTMTTSGGSVFAIPTNPVKRGDVPQPTPTPAPALHPILERLESPAEHLGVARRRLHEHDRRKLRNKQLV